jgi:uncharacterized membrane protein
MENENNNLNDLRGDFENMKEAVLALSRSIEKQNERLDRLEHGKKETELDALHAERFSKQPGTPPPPPPPPPLPAVALAKEGVLPKPKADFEQEVGITWFSRIGMVALVLGVSFFLKYAFDNGWIGETGRVMIGIVIGITLLGFGEKFIRKYFGYGQILTGGGIVVLYLSLFSAFNFYHLIDAPTAFVFMVIVTAIGVLLSVRYNALTLMVTSVIGGFAAPFMVSTGENQQVALFSYVLLLDLAILGVSVFKRWHEVHFIGFIGTLLLVGGWFGEFYTKEQLWSTFFFFTLFFLVYSLSALVYNLYKKEKSTGTEQILSLFTGVVYFSSSYAILNPDYHPFMGFFALIMAIYYFLWAYLVRALTSLDDKLYGFLAVLSTGFITLAIGIQFEQNIITIGWLIEAMLLAYTGVATKNRLVKGVAIVVSVLAMVRMLFLDSSLARDAVAVFNERFFTYLFGIISLYIMAWIWKTYTKESGLEIEAKKLATVFMILANFFTLFAGSLEITTYYDKQVRHEQNTLNVLTQQQDVNGRFGYQDEYNTRYQDTYKIQNQLENKSSISLSIFWIIYAIILLLVGVSLRSRGVRIGGLMLLLFAILKLFFYDLWSLGTLYRIISSMTLGVVLLSVSYGYQKYKDKFKEII